MQPIAQPEQMQNDGDSVGETRCHILRLPAELILMVIDCLSEDEIPSTEKNLLSLCLSSKALLPMAKRRLYQFNAARVKNHKTQNDAKKEACDWACLDWAIQRGRKETVESVMEITPDVCELRHLSTAILKKHFEIAWMLLKQETVHTKLKIRTQDSPIFAAVEVGHTELIDEIIKIQKGLEVSMFDRNDKTVLHYACKHGHLSLVRRFLAEKANPYATAKPEFAATSLMAAIECNLPTARHAIIKEILASRPSHPHSDQQYKFYMSGIASKCNLDDLELFMGKGFFKPVLNSLSPYISVNTRWWYWLSEARSFDNTEIFRRLLELCPAEYDTDYLYAEVFDMIASSRVSGGIGVREVKMLIDRFQPTGLYMFGPVTRPPLRTAMSYAIQKDEVGLMESLLHFFDLAGQTRDHRDKVKWGSKGENILSGIDVPHSSGMLNLLLQHGFDVNHVGYDEDGNTPLQRAIKEVQRYDKGTEAIKDMIPIVNNIDAVNHRGRTALHLCVDCPQAKRRWPSSKVMEIAIILVNNKANLSVRDNDGNTPLHFAASSRLLDPLMKLFLSRGADMNAQNHRGETPLMFLRSWEDSSTEETLTERRLSFEIQARSNKNTAV